MANVMFAARQATTDALSTVSAASSAISVGAGAIADLTAAGAAHAAHYRQTTEAELKLTAEEFKDIASQRARMRIARATLDIENELEADPALKAVYDRVSLTTDEPQKPALKSA